jgi:HSP20 family protein
MANITVRNQPLPAPVTPYLDVINEPLRMMRNLLSWDPFREMAPLPVAERVVFNPDFEIKETANAYEFRADLPGVKEKDVEVSLIGNRLHIIGKRDPEKIEETDTLYAAERRYGAFTRIFTLPEGVDTEHVFCELKEGVLFVAVPKAPEAKPKRIPVQVGLKTKA